MNELIEQYSSRLKWISVLIFIVIVFLCILWVSGKIPDSDIGDQIDTIRPMFIIVSLISIAIALFYSKRLVKTAINHPNSNRMGLLMIIPVLQISAFASISFFGFILGLLGDGAVSVALFFLVSVVGMVFVFPTKTKLSKLSQQLFPDDEQNTIS